MMMNCENLVDPNLIQFCLEQEHINLERVEDANNFFLLFASAMVLFMEAGFAMLSVGVIRPKNFKNMILSIMMDFCLCGIAFFFVGFGLAFGQDVGGFIGTTNFVGLGVGSEPIGELSFGFYLINFLWACIRATIVTGAVAERANFFAYCTYSFYMSVWVYPVVVHWVYGRGFLTMGLPTSLLQSGVVDFAACGPIHMLGGLGGAIVSKMLGPRIGRYNSSGELVAFKNSLHPALASLGVFILWTGWLGFNPGSVIFLSGNGEVVTRAAVNSLLSSCTGTITALITFYFFNPERTVDLAMGLNGALAGLVSVTGSCPYIEMWAALVIGGIGGIVLVLASSFVLHILKIDDPLDATAVHLFCGGWGLLAGAFFANPVLLVPFYQPGSVVPSGIVYGGQSYMTISANGTQTMGGDQLGGTLLVNALVLMVLVYVWTIGWVLPLVYALNRMGWLRALERDEMKGMDFLLHGGVADDFEPEEKKTLLVEKEQSVSRHHRIAPAVVVLDKNEDKNDPTAIEKPTTEVQVV